MRLRNQHTATNITSDADPAASAPSRFVSIVTSVKAHCNVGVKITHALIELSRDTSQRKASANDHIEANMQMLEARIQESMHAKAQSDEIVRNLRHEVTILSAKLEQNERARVSLEQEVQNLQDTESARISELEGMVDELNSELGKQEASVSEATNNWMASEADVKDAVQKSVELIQIIKRTMLNIDSVDGLADIVDMVRRCAFVACFG